MPPAFSASRAGVTPEASRDRSSGTFGRKYMRTLIGFVLIATASILADDSPIIPASDIDPNWTIRSQSFASGIGFVHYHHLDDWRYPLVEVSLRQFPSNQEAKEFFTKKFPDGQTSRYTKPTSDAQNSFDYLDRKMREMLLGRWIIKVTQSGPDTFDDRKPFIDAYVKMLKE